MKGEGGTKEWSLRPQVTGESSKRPQLLEGLGVTDSERGSLPFDGVLGNVTIQDLTTSYKHRLSTGETTKSRKGPVGREKAITLYTLGQGPSFSPALL